MILRSKHLMCLTIISTWPNLKAKRRPLLCLSFMVDVNPQILRFEWGRHSFEQWHMWHRDTSVFYEDFDLVKNEAAKKQNRVIMELVRKKERKAEDVENYKENIQWFQLTFTKVWPKIFICIQTFQTFFVNTTKYSERWKRLFCVNHAAH